LFTILIAVGKKLPLPKKRAAEPLLAANHGQFA
jgi:hypothetical protein